MVLEECSRDKTYPFDSEYHARPRDMLMRKSKHSFEGSMSSWEGVQGNVIRGNFCQYTDLIYYYENAWCLSRSLLLTVTNFSRARKLA